MPFMTGEDMVLQAREVRPDLKVIFLTGCVSDMHMDWSTSETTYVLSKPVKLEALLEAILTMLSLPTYLPPTTNSPTRTHY
jgi:FixJ family two-component response regulator